MISRYLVLELIVLITIFSVRQSSAESSCSEEAPCRYKDVRTLSYHGLMKMREYRDCLLKAWKDNPIGQKHAIDVLTNFGIPSEYMNYFLFGDYETVIEIAEKHTHDPNVISDCHSTSTDLSPETSDSKTESGDIDFDSTGSIFSCSGSNSETSHSETSDSETSDSETSNSETSDSETSNSKLSISVKSLSESSSSEDSMSDSSDSLSSESKSTESETSMNEISISETSESESSTSETESSKSETTETESSKSETTETESSKSETTETESSKSGTSGSDSSTDTDSSSENSSQYFRIESSKRSSCDCDSDDKKLIVLNYPNRPSCNSCNTCNSCNNCNNCNKCNAHKSYSSNDLLHHKKSTYKLKLNI